ncbi:MAG: MarR family transcriptional regulator [Firmicutes bacterium]|nr:MarR family transcriptional regulator [Bacillota bacterium]
MNEKDEKRCEAEMPELRLNRALHRCGHYLHRCDTHPRQAAVLRLLKERGTLSQREVQENLGIRPGSASELISKLEDRGMLKRERDKADKRKIMLSLTAKGIEFNPTLTDEMLAERYKSLSADEMQTLIALLEKLLESPSFGGDEK